MFEGVKNMIVPGACLELSDWDGLDWNNKHRFYIMCVEDISCSDEDLNLLECVGFESCDEQVRFRSEYFILIEAASYDTYPWLKEKYLWTDHNVMVTYRFNDKVEGYDYLTNFDNNHRVVNIL